MTDNGETAIRPAQALHDLVEWSESLDDPLPMWQRDAMRRLYKEQELKTTDVDDLLAICKAYHDLLDDGERLSEVREMCKSDTCKSW